MNRPEPGGWRRRRAIVFGLLAVAAAALAAVIADGYGARIASSYGRLRPVVIVRDRLPARHPIGPPQLERLETRRVPARFVPPGTLTRRGEALGLAPRAELAPGTYLTASALRSPGHPGQAAVPGLRGDERPVEIAVSGARALLVEPTPTIHPRVDVVVTTEPSATGAGRTFVAAADVPLLGIDPIDGGSAPGSTAAATLGLTRGQALELIAAQSFARQVTLLPRAGGVSRWRLPPERRASRDRP